MKPTITVITTSYNQAEYIGECIESLQKQTFTNWEQIIIDDGSTDNTKEVVEKYQQSDSRIKFIRKEHGGVARLIESYDIGLCKSKGDYIAILEADDWSEPDRFGRQLQYFNYKNTVLVYGKASATDGRIVPTIRPDLMSEEKMLREMFLGCHIPALTVMIKKEALVKSGGFKTHNGLGGVDYPTWLSVLPYGEFIFLNTILSNWRIHNNNLSRKQGNKIKQVFDCGYKWYKKMPSEVKCKVGLSDIQMYSVNRFRLLKSLAVYYKGR